MKIKLALLLGLFLFSCQDEAEQSTGTVLETDDVALPPVKVTVYEVVVSENGTNNFGYQILQDEKVMINQQTIPAIPGNSGFSTKEKAKRAGEFMLSKIKRGSFPPTVSPAELDSLDVL